MSIFELLMSLSVTFIIVKTLDLIESNNSDIDSLSEMELEACVASTSQTSTAVDTSSWNQRTEAV